MKKIISFKFIRRFLRRVGVGAAIGAVALALSGVAIAHMPHVNTDLIPNPDPTNITKPDGSPAQSGNQEIWVHPTGDATLVTDLPGDPDLVGNAVPSTRDVRNIQWAVGGHGHWTYYKLTFTAIPSDLDWFELVDDGATSRQPVRFVYYRTSAPPADTTYVRNINIRTSANAAAVATATGNKINGVADTLPNPPGTGNDPLNVTASIDGTGMLWVNYDIPGTVGNNVTFGKSASSVPLTWTPPAGVPDLNTPYWGYDVLDTGAAPGGTVVLKAQDTSGNYTAFYFNAGAADRVALTKSISIRGEPDGGTPTLQTFQTGLSGKTVLADRTVIYQGNAVFRSLAANPDVSIGNVWFDSFLGGAVQILRGGNVAVWGAKARNFSVADASGGVAQVTVINVNGGGAGANVTGNVSVEDNDIQSDLTPRDTSLGPSVRIRKQAINVANVRPATPPIINVKGNTVEGQFQIPLNGAVGVNNSYGTINIGEKDRGNTITVKDIPDGTIPLDGPAGPVGYFMNGLQSGHTFGGTYNVEWNTISVPRVADGFIFPANDPAPNSGVVTNGTIYKNTVTGDHSFILISLPRFNDNVIVDGNTFLGTGSAAIGFEGPFPGGTPTHGTGNRITNNDSSGFTCVDYNAFGTFFPQFAQLYIPVNRNSLGQINGQITNTIISGNKFGNGKRGIWMTDSSNNVVTNNTFGTASVAQVIVDGSASHDNIVGSWTDPNTSQTYPGNVFGPMQLTYDLAEFLDAPKNTKPNPNLHKLLTQGVYVDNGQQDTFQDNDFTSCILYDQNGSLTGYNDGGYVPGWAVDIPNPYDLPAEHLGCMLLGEQSSLAQIYEHPKLGTKYFPTGTTMCTQIDDTGTGNYIHQWTNFCTDSPNKNIDEIRERWLAHQAWQEQYASNPTLGASWPE